MKEVILLIPDTYSGPSSCTVVTDYRCLSGMSPEKRVRVAAGCCWEGSTLILNCII